MSYLGVDIRQLIESYRYAYPSARAKALKSFLLTGAQIDNLLDARGLEGAVQILRETPYGPSLSAKADIFELELALNRDLAKNLIKVSDFLPGSAKTIFKAYLEKYEAENIKSILIGVHSKLPGEKGLRMVVPFYINLQKSHYENLASSKTVEDVISALTGTVYHPALSQAYKEYEVIKAIFPLIAALDSLVYTRMSDVFSRYSGSDVEALNRMIGVEVDIKNIKTVFRLISSHTKPKDITSYLIPGGYRIGIQLQEEISKAHNVEEAIARLEKTYYHDTLVQAHREFEMTLEDKRLHMLEKSLDDFRAGVERGFEREFPLAIGPILGYVAAKVREVRKLILILKLKDEGFTKGEILEVLGAL